MENSMMRAVVFKEPGKVVIEKRPIPKVEDPKDIIIKVDYTALCGSELHTFRGHEASKADVIMGHEFTGTVTDIGDAVRTVNVGDKVVSPFTISCGVCFYCKNRHSSRCEKSRLFGSFALAGGQAEYVRIPLADSTAFKAPPHISDDKLVLMADIFPTGYFAASNGFDSLSGEQITESTVVVIGCGPVGLCAVINAEDRKPKHLLAVDSIPSRLELARTLGAEPFNFQTEMEGLRNRVKEATEGRGADIVIEVVGLSPALRLGFDLLRPWGTISSVGVHNGEIPWTGAEGYGKNLKLQMGRCSVRSIFPQALAQLEKKQHLLGFMSDNIMPLSDAVEGYELFNQMKVQKVIFKAQE